MASPGTGTGWETGPTSAAGRGPKLDLSSGGSIWDAPTPGTGTGGFRTSNDVPGTGTGWETGPVLPVAAHSSGGGGFLGGLFHALGKAGGELVGAAEHTPGAIVHLGKLEGQALAHDAKQLYEHPTQTQSFSSFLHGNSGASRSLGHIEREQVTATKQDLEHPLRHPGYTLLDALGLASAGAGAVGRLGAAGRALTTVEDVGAASRLANAGKALVQKPLPITRVVSHDGVSVKLPAADNPLTRTLQHGIDALREKFPNVPLVGAAHVVGKELGRNLRSEARRAEAPIQTMQALAGKAGMLKRTSKLGRYTADALARQHALRVVAEGVPTADRIAFHERALERGYKSAAQNPAIRAMRESTFTAGHEEQIALNRAAQKYLDESGPRPKPKLVDPKMQAVYDQMLKVAGNRESLISQLGKLRDETMTGRLQKPGQLLTGDESFSHGEMRIPTTPADKAAVKVTQAMPKYAGGEIKAPGSLTHAYSGGAYLGGKIRNDVVRLMAESALEAQKHFTLLHVADKLRGAAKELPTSEHDVPIVLDHLPGRPSLVKARAMLNDESKFEPGMAQLSHGYEGLRQAIFPDKIEAATEPIPGVHWIDERLLGGLNKPNPLGALMQYSSGRKLVGSVDAINNASKLAILYLKPAYVAPNLLSNLAMNFVQQGFAAPANLARAARLWLNADDETINNVLGSMGHGATGSLDTQAGKLSRPVHVLASKFAKPVDVVPRIASFLYEARRAGVTTPESLRALFEDPANADTLEEITRRANAAMVDFDNLTPIERSIIGRVIFFYPWVKGSAAWLGRFPLEHPVGAGAVSQLGQVGAKEQDAALGQYIPAWAEGLIPIGTGPHGMPETIDPFTVTPFDTSAKLAQSIGEAVTGHPKLAANSILDQLSPATKMAVDLLSSGAPTAVHDLYANTPPALTIGQALGVGSKTYPYEGTPLQALMRYLVGTGFVPRETDTQTLERSYEDERKNR